jgi:hypothetical protein
VAYEFSLADVSFLRSPAGEEALDRCGDLALTSHSYIADVEQARRLVGDWSAAVVETLMLRRKAPSKIDNSQRWLFEGNALQQASASVVARHRAARLFGRDIHDVTCSIGADLVELARVAHRCIGSDVDAVRLAMARHNTDLGGVSPVLLRADALAPVSRGTVIVADPARRDSSGKRTWRPQDFAPGLDDLVSAYPGRDLVVKCAPGIAPEVVPWASEIELVSLNGQVREACLWRMENPDGVTRRASVLRSDGSLWTVTDVDSDDIPVKEPGSWLIDPDGAVVRAGLVRHYAARHGLWQLDERIAYLTGDVPPPGIRAFRVLEFGPYREKDLRKALRAREIGRLEILVRGLDIDPDAMRGRLKLQGTEEASVVLTRIGRTPYAFICRAERIDTSSS